LCILGGAMFGVLRPNASSDAWGWGFMAGLLLSTLIGCSIGLLSALIALWRRERVWVLSLLGLALNAIPAAHFLAMVLKCLVGGVQK
jgi:hypothetical protein